MKAKLIFSLPLLLALSCNSIAQQQQDAPKQSPAPAAADSGKDTKKGKKPKKETLSADDILSEWEAGQKNKSRRVVK